VFGQDVEGAGGVFGTERQGWPLEIGIEGRVYFEWKCFVQFHCGELVLGLRLSTIDDTIYFIEHRLARHIFARHAGAFFHNCHRLAEVGD